MMDSSPDIDAIPQSSDSSLARRAARGDHQAFAALFERYFEGLYDFSLRTSRQEPPAAGVVQTAFERLLVSFHQGRIPDNLKTWLFTMARGLCIDEYRRSPRPVSGDEDDEDAVLPLPSPPGTEPSIEDTPEAFSQKEQVDLVWGAAAALNPDDYSLLDLHLRQGMDRDELAESLGLKHGALYTRLSRLKDALEQTVVCLLLLRHGLSSCQELSGLAAGMGQDALTPESRKTIWNHLQDCRLCQETRSKLASPLILFAGLPLLSAPEGVKTTIWRRLEAKISGFPASKSQAGRENALRWLVLGIPVVFAAFLIAAALAWMFLMGGRDPSNVHSTSHQVGVASPQRLVAVEWTPRLFTSAYAVLWSTFPSDIPDTQQTLPGSTRHVSSNSLSDGAWYFHLRTQGWNGSWTNTVHLGPFLISSFLSPAPPAPLAGRPVAPSPILASDTAPPAP